MLLSSSFYSYGGAVYSEMGESNQLKNFDSMVETSSIFHMKDDQISTRNMSSNGDDD